MYQLVRTLQKTLPLLILAFVCVSAAQAQAQRPQTTVVNDTDSPVTVVVVNPPFPPLELNTIPAGQSSTIGAPAGATLQIVNAQTGDIVSEIPVNTTRKVALTESSKPRASGPPSGNARGQQIAQRRNTQPASSTDEGSDGTLHMIIACDTDDPVLGEGFEINEGLIRSYFIDAVATRSLRFYAPWSGVDGDGSTKLTGRSLLEAVEDIEVEPNDTLMVYVACHGFWDNDENEQWFRFENASDSALERKTLIDRIKSRNTRLGMLVTDACTNYEKLPANKSAGPEIGEPLETTLPLCQALFFDQEGFLDLSSSSPGQFTLYYNNYKDLQPGDSLQITYSQKERMIPGSKGTLVATSQFLNRKGMKGGLFTESILGLLETHQHKTYDWKKFTDLLREDVEERFDEEIPDGQLETGAGTIFQDAQTVAVNELPGSLEDTDTPTEPDQKMAKGRDRKMAKGRGRKVQTGHQQASIAFGVTGYKNDKGGFLILEVIDDTPAARLGLKVGEVIEKVNNQPVNSPEELEEALANAAATFRITVGGASFVVRP